MNKSIYFLFVIIIISITSCKQKEYVIQEVGDNIYFTNANDSVLLGSKRLKKDIFSNYPSTLFPTQDNVFSDCPDDLSNDIHELFGVYINKKMLDNLSFINKKPEANHINLVYIYPEKKRYNYQCSKVVGVKIAEYVDPWYQENPPLDLNPYTIDSIIKIDDNKIRFYGKENEFDFIMQPNISININTWSKADSDGSNTTTPINSYIRLDDAITSINFYVDSLHYYIPQDLTEIYLRELTTRLLNLKNRTNFKTSELIK